jgi:tetratricopeptide (TPR) repeat protein
MWLDSIYSWGLPSKAEIQTALKEAFKGYEKELTKQKVNYLIELGNQLFKEEKYSLALQNYLKAYALIEKLVYNQIPEWHYIANPGFAFTTDLFDYILAGAAEVLKIGADVDWVEAKIVAPIDPLPKEVRDLGMKYIPGPKPSPEDFHADCLRNIGNMYIRTGEPDKALSFLNRAINLAKAEEIRAATEMSVGTAYLLKKQTAEAEIALESSLKRFVTLGKSVEAAAVRNNLGLLYEFKGESERAKEFFKEAARRLPSKMKHIDLPSGRISERAVSILQPSKSISELRVKAQDKEASSLDVSSSARFDLLLLGSDIEIIGSFETLPAGEKQEVLGVLVGDELKTIDLTKDIVNQLKTQIYEPRVTMDTIKGLNIIGVPTKENLIAGLGHIYCFVLPLSIGDCYFELGEYEKAIKWYQKARDYKYLNKPIEAPLVWQKMANVFLRWGNMLFEENQKEEAKGKYEKIVCRSSSWSLDLNSPLYKSPVFDDVRSQVEQILSDPDIISAEKHHPGIATIVLLAKLNLECIELGIDLPLLSLKREQIPVFTFEYLQNVARYFANHAIQAERTYINFKTSAEKEEFSKKMLEDAVALAEANVNLEAKYVEVAKKQKDVVNASYDHAEKQYNNMVKMKDDYEAVGLEQVILDSEITYVGAPTTKYDFRGYGEYGISDGVHRVDEVLRTLTKRRRSIAYHYELRNMGRRIEELKAAREVAQQQKDVAQKQYEAALTKHNIATLRRDQAKELLDLFDSQVFTPELWHRLANEMKWIADNYVCLAVVFAKLMEEAYEFEIGEEVNIIKPLHHYKHSELSGLLAGDFLLQDIDFFTYLRIVDAKKKIPIKEIISLADLYPLQFLYQFKKTGRIDFRTDLLHFDHKYPGTYQRRIKRVEVIVEGVVSWEGIHGTLTNTGLSLTRLHNGDIKMRLLEPETIILSRYQIGPDSIIFQPDKEMLAVFENSPVATSWILELPPSRNDLHYNFISDIKLVLYYEAFYDHALKQSVLEDIAETQPTIGTRGIALRYEFFDEYFTLQDTGKVEFELTTTIFPFNHTNPRIKQMSILFDIEEGIDKKGLTVQIDTADGVSVTQTTDVNGMITTGEGSSLNTFIDHPLLQKWTIAIPKDSNQTHFDAGFDWTKIRNIFFFIEYEFTPRIVDYEPHLLLYDSFEEDPLSSFDIIDDPKATISKPSNWKYNQEKKRIEQKKNIYGGTMDVSPNKPGTYLVRKTTDVFPTQKNFILCCRLQSDDNDGIGVVFRYQDVDNFYFFLMDSQRNYRRIGKKVGGTFQELDTSAVDTTQGYIVGKEYNLKIRIMGNQIKAFLDGVEILAGEDSSISTAGRVGFYSWANNNAMFNDMKVIVI